MYVLEEIFSSIFLRSKSEKFDLLFSLTCEVDVAILEPQRGVPGYLSHKVENGPLPSQFGVDCVLFHRTLRTRRLATTLWLRFSVPPKGMGFENPRAPSGSELNEKLRNAQFVFFAWCRKQNLFIKAWNQPTVDLARHASVQTACVTKIEKN